MSKSEALTSSKDDSSTYLGIAKNPTLAKDENSIQMLRTLRQNECDIQCDENMEIILSLYFKDVCKIQ